MKEVWYSFARDPLINFANKSHELEGHRVEMAQRAFYLLLAQDPPSERNYSQFIAKFAKFLRLIYARASKSFGNATALVD